MRQNENIFFFLEERNKNEITKDRSFLTKFTRSGKEPPAGIMSGRFQELRKNKMLARLDRFFLQLK
ncbi:MAG: hypothetical protein A2Y94_03145 [Caldithrix sp. RBG_13_44_9]|nr:MAG: hypothetical protein A2Y94_03145 [Caldithrix sp. RBG_13_44_9]